MNGLKENNYDILKSKKLGEKFIIFFRYIYFF